MSNFNDLYDHVAADRSRAMQLLGIQDIRRKAVAELLAAGAYTEPDNIDDMTDAEREQHKAEAAYGLGRPHILEAAKMPVQDGDETYAIAVTATSEHPNCIALCIQTKLEELYASGIVDRSANHRPRLFVVAANDRPDEDVQGLSTALDMLRVAYPDFHIELSERTPEQAMRAALAEDLRDALDACKINASKENFQRLAATMIAAPLFFPAQRPEGEAAPEDGQQHLQFGKVRTDDGRTFFCAFTDRARLLQWRNMGSVELGVKDYAPLVLSSNDTGIIIDPGVGSGLALTREMLQTLKAQLEFFDQMRNTAAEMGVDFDADAVAEAVAHMAIDTAARNVLVTHQFVTGGARSGSEELSVGGTDNVDSSVFAPFDYVALGHLHGAQQIGRPTIRYAGSPLKYSFSEASQRKSVTVVTLGEKGAVDVRTVPLTPLRDLREIRGSYDELTARSFYEHTTYRSDYLHLILTDEQDVFDAMSRLRTIYPYLMTLDYDNARTRAAGGMSVPAETERRTPLELFETLYQRQNHQPMSEVQREYIAQLMEQIMEVQG